MAGPNILRAIHPRHNPTQETLNRLLKPFKLKLSLPSNNPSAAAPRSKSMSRARLNRLSWEIFRSLALLACLA